MKTMMMMPQIVMEDDFVIWLLDLLHLIIRSRAPRNGKLETRKSNNKAQKHLINENELFPIIISCDLLPLRFHITQKVLKWFLTHRFSHSLKNFLQNFPWHHHKKNIYVLKWIPVNSKWASYKRYTRGVENININVINIWRWQIECNQKHLISSFCDIFQTISFYA